MISTLFDLKTRTVTVRRCSGLVVSALVFRLSSLSSSPGLGRCVVFLSRTLYSLSASLHQGVQMGTGIPSRGSRNTPIVTSCYRNQDIY